MYRIVNSRDRQCAEIVIVKQAAKHAARALRDDDRVRFSKPLKPCRKIRGLTNDRLFLGGALTEEITFTSAGRLAQRASQPSSAAGDGNSQQECD
jgi:hypothetical protein